MRKSWGHVPPVPPSAPRFPRPCTQANKKTLRLFYAGFYYSIYLTIFTTSRMQGHNFNIFLGVSELCPTKFVCVTFLFLVKVVYQIVLGPVRCPAIIHCTAVFALRKVIVSWLWGGSPSCPLMCRPCLDIKPPPCIQV